MGVGGKVEHEEGRGEAGCGAGWLCSCCCGGDEPVSGGGDGLVMIFCALLPVGSFVLEMCLISRGCSCGSRWVLFRERVQGVEAV